MNKPTTVMGIFVAGVIVGGWAQQGAVRTPVVSFWSGADLKKLAVDLAPAAKAADIGVAAKPLLNLSTHGITQVNRAGGVAEVHEFDSDIFIIQDGEGTIELGGELVDPKVIRPGQETASSIRGGRMFKVAAGDVFYIPKKTPHMWHLVGNQQVAHLAIRVTEH